VFMKKNMHKEKILDTNQRSPAEQAPSRGLPHTSGSAGGR